MKLLLSITALLCGHVMANGVAMGFKVTEVRVDRDGKGYVTFDQPLTRSPASCGTPYPKSLSFDTTTAPGRAIYSMALAAQISGKTITAEGTGTCPEYGVVEGWLLGVQAQ